MIKNPENTKGMTISVYLKNGEEFLDKDITNQPITEKVTFICFWLEGKIRAYPASEVRMFEYGFGNNKDAA